MKKILQFIFAVFLVTGTPPAFSQTNRLEKTLDKAKELVKDGKLEDADKLLDKFLKDDPDNGQAWDYLSTVRYKEYKESKANDLNFTIETKDKDGKLIDNKDDSLGGQLAQMLNNLKPYKIAWAKYVYTLRKGTLVSSDAAECCFRLRLMFVDQPVDTNLSKKAMRYFEDAEDEFSKKNYGDAAKSYQRAIEEQPDFYKARLYLGDAYYFTGNYKEAIKSFSEASKKFPNLIEPRKFLVDAYMKDRQFNEAYDEAVKGMAVYPDLAMGMKLDNAAYMLDKKIDIQWIPRGVFPNKIAHDSEDAVVYNDPNKLVPVNQWKAYADAMEKIRDKCDDKGLIVKKSADTQSDYMEVFSWEEMLKNSIDPSLEDARKKQQDGFLDCYAFITCYHIDIYDQYLDFVTKHRNKVEEYYKKYTLPKKDALK